MFSLATHTDEAFKGADWGAGAAGVLVGNITPDISFAGIIGNMWGDSGNFNTLTLQPMLYYNIPSMPGTAIAYNSMFKFLRKSCVESNQYDLRKVTSQ